jgi:hypothetical protein
MQEPCPGLWSVARAGPGAWTRMRRQRHLFCIQGAVMTALVLCLAVTASSSLAAARRHGHHSARKTQVRKRQALLKQLRRNPRLALRASFMRQASDLDLDLPLTVRFNRALDSTPLFGASDDVLEIAWNDDAGLWPAGFILPPTSVADVALSRGFSMVAHFGADTAGYGQPGVIETSEGQNVELETATAGPIEVADSDPACGTATVRIDTMSFGRGDVTQGVLDLFNGQARGRLHLRATTTSSIRPTCADDWVNAGTYISEAPDPVLPITFTGAFRVSPAITADGYVRLGTISISDAAGTQTSSFGQIKVCTEPSDPTCQPQGFTARLKLKNLTAELLLGEAGL